MFCFLICFYSNTIFYRKHMLASLTLLSVIDLLLCRELYILPCSNSSFTSLINHCCSLCSHYPYCHSSSFTRKIQNVFSYSFRTSCAYHLIRFSIYSYRSNAIVPKVYPQAYTDITVYISINTFRSNRYIPLRHQP